MYKHLLESAGDINWMAVLPLIIFVAFFVAVMVITFMRSKTHIQHMAELPLKEDHKNEKLEL